MHQYYRSEDQEGQIFQQFAHAKEADGKQEKVQEKTHQPFNLNEQNNLDVLGLGAFAEELNFQMWDGEQDPMPELQFPRLKSFVSDFKLFDFQSEQNIQEDQKTPIIDQKNEPEVFESVVSQKTIKQFGDFLKIKNVKKGWKKNTNLPKFLVRVYMKYYQDYTVNSSQSAFNFFKRAKKQLKLRGSNAFKISDVMRLFENEKRTNPQLGKNNRETLALILRETSQDEIVNSHYIQGNLKSYLVGSKVYALRCRSKTLVQRVKIM